MAQTSTENARIAETYLGIEDHGIFAFAIVLEGDAWRQGTGLMRVGEASMKILQGIVSQFGPWEKLPGTLVRVKRQGERIVELGDPIRDKWVRVFTAAG